MDMQAVQEMAPAEGARVVCGTSITTRGSREYEDLSPTLRKLPRRQVLYMPLFMFLSQHIAASLKLNAIKKELKTSALSTLLISLEAAQDIDRLATEVESIEDELEATAQQRRYDVQQQLENLSANCTSVDGRLRDTNVKPFCQACRLTGRTKLIY